MRRTLTLAFAAAALAGCGGVAASGDGASTTGGPTFTTSGALPTIKGQVLATTSTVKGATGSTPTSAGGVTTPTRAGQSPCTATGSSGSTPINVAARDDAATKLKITLTVAKKVCFAKGEEITVAAEIVNTGKDDFRYSSTLSSITTIGPWVSTCATTRSPDPDYPVLLVSGDKQRPVFATYTAGQGGCATIPAGVHQVSAVIRQCPESTLTKQKTCDDAKVVQIATASVAIEVR